MLRNMMHHLMEDGGMGMRMPGVFNVQLRCYSAPFYSQYKENKVKEVNNSGKILLPSSALDMLIRMNIDYPMTFAMVNPENGKRTHVGVLEFVAEEGRCYAPAWVMMQLGLREEALVTVAYKALPTATDAKFKPMSVDFLNISNPRAVLEMELRNFFCLTKGDRIAFEYNNQQYEVLVQETKPENAVTIVECNLNVEFDAPEGYVEPNYGNRSQPSAAAASTAEQDPDTLTMPPEVVSPAAADAFQAFGGQGNRLDGKKRRAADSQSSATSNRLNQVSPVNKSIEGATDAASSVMSEEYDPTADGQPAFDYTPGTLQFYRDYVRPERLVELRAEKKQTELDAAREERAAAHAASRTNKKASRADVDSHFASFKGKGQSLR